MRSLSKCSPPVVPALKIAMKRRFAAAEDVMIARTSDIEAPAGISNDPCLISFSRPVTVAASLNMVALPTAPAPTSCPTAPGSVAPCGMSTYVGAAKGPGFVY